MKNELLAIIEAHEQNALGTENSALATDRAYGMKLYLGELLGNEVEGRSQVISRDVYDTVEWIKPSLLKIFMSGDEICRFDPVDVQDIESSEQETYVVNNAILEKNNAYELMHNWIHDGLVSKNGYVKAYWKTSEEVTEEEYNGLTEDELALMLQDKSIEVIGVNQYMDEMGVPLIDVRISLKRERGRVQIDNIPPEEILVDVNHRGVSVLEANFVQHRRRVTISELREMGYDVDDRIGGGDEMSTYEEITRSLYDESDEKAETEAAMREVIYRETYLRTDQDKDGIAELRKVCVVGDEVLHNEVVDIIPIACWTPSIMPHRHVGMSIADAIDDLQVIKTQLLRNALDQQALSIHGRFAIDASRVNLDDMLTSRPGGLVRVDGSIGDAIMPLINPVDGTRNISMLEYWDNINARRTGVSQAFQGLDPNALNRTATGTQMLQTAAQERVLLIARSLAETGMKDLVKIVHKTLKQNQSKAEVVRMRNKWITVDPTSWRTRYDMTVSVGLGTGNKDVQLAHLQTILMAQKEAIMLGIATPKNIYNALAKLTTNAGFRNVEEFWTDPEMAQPKEPQPDPQVQMEQAKLQNDVQKTQAQMQMDQQKAQQEAMIRQQEAEQKAQLEQQKLALEAQKIQMQIELEKWKAELQAKTDLQIAMFKERNQEFRV